MNSTTPSPSPPPLKPFDVSLSHFLSPPSDPTISSLSATSFSLLLAHNGLISSYDVTTLSRLSTFRTHLDDVTSITQISPSISAVGSLSSPALHFYNTLSKSHVASSHWSDPSDLRTHKARVTSLSDSLSQPQSNSLFASFECPHGENAVLEIDVTTLKAVSEIGRQSGNSARSASINKLKWVPSLGVLVGSKVTCGAFGYSGYVRLWDPRVGGGNAVVWETSEPGGVCRVGRIGDTMADVDVDVDGLFIAKVGSRSGDLGLADMRKLNDDPWVYLEDPNPALNGPGAGAGVGVVSCYEGSVFVGRGGGLEAWSRVERRETGGGGGGGGGTVTVTPQVAHRKNEEEEREWGVYRRNYVDKEEDGERGVIWRIEGGGNRLFVCRENGEGVEVWETSEFSGFIMVDLEGK